MRYTSDLGCRFKWVPHNIRIVHEDKKAKWEVCMICQKRWRWNKRYQTRIDNNEYLKAHLRNFAQPEGPTKRVYHKIYKQKDTVIII